MKGYYSHPYHSWDKKRFKESQVKAIKLVFRKHLEKGSKPKMWEIRNARRTNPVFAREMRNKSNIQIRNKIMCLPYEAEYYPYFFLNSYDPLPDV